MRLQPLGKLTALPQTADTPAGFGRSRPKIKKHEKNIKNKKDKYEKGKSIPKTKKKLERALFAVICSRFCIYFSVTYFAERLVMAVL